MSAQKSNSIDFNVYMLHIDLSKDEKEVNSEIVSQCKGNILAIFMDYEHDEAMVLEEKC